MRVVGNMHAFMQEIAITDNRLPARIGRTVDHYVFTDHIVIADNGQRSVTLIFEILSSAAITAPLNTRLFLPKRAPLMMLA